MLEFEEAEEAWWWWGCGAWPRWPSLMAVVERVEREVVVELGVPLWGGGQLLVCGRGGVGKESVRDVRGGYGVGGRRGEVDEGGGRHHRVFYIGRF